MRTVEIRIIELRDVYNYFKSLYKKIRELLAMTPKQFLRFIDKRIINWKCTTFGHDIDEPKLKNDKFHIVKCRRCKKDVMAEL